MFVLHARFLTTLFAGHLLDDLSQVDLGAEELLLARERAVASHLRAPAAGRRRGRGRFVSPLLGEAFDGALTQAIVDAVDA